MDKQSLKIVFFGTPDFAVESLKQIIDNHFNVLAVVTSPDKPAGRGQKIQMSAVKKFALENNLMVLQPTNLKSEDFMQTLQSLGHHLQIVIAFRMLPEKVWNLPSLGTFNLHGSYLPYYRGAAPINRAIMNGEKETGVTTFFLKHEIDTGSIILREKTIIEPHETAGSLHDKLMKQGAELVVKSLEKIIENKLILTEQEQGDFPHAPKIFEKDCQINWQEPAEYIYNQIRGLSPYPCAFTQYDGKKLKIFECLKTDIESSEPGNIEIVGKHQILAACSDFKLQITKLQLEGKKAMSATDFINGLRL
jgi:methionyl-tRNA formyltransferase